MRTVLDIAEIVQKTFKRKGNRAVAVQNVELEGPSGLAVQVFPSDPLLFLL